MTRICEGARSSRPLGAVLASLLLASVNPAPAQAANLFHKFGRGVTNTATGWYELPASIGHAKREGTVVLWLVTGTVEGLVKGMTRTLVGIWDMVTFPIPPYDSALLDPPTLITEKPPRETTPQPPAL